MEFDKSKVFTSLNADELKVGSKAIVASSLDELKEYVESDCDPSTIECIQPEYCPNRFTAFNKYFNLAYLISEPEEKKLNWSDLKIGDIIRKKNLTSMVVGIDTMFNTHFHIFAGNNWIEDSEIESDWEKVE